MSERLSATLKHALERGATVLTASAEQARAIHTAWGITQRNQGRRSWPTPDVLSVQAWVMRCWSQAIAIDEAGALPQILSATQDFALWERVVLADASTMNLLQPFGAVRAARRAWQRVHDWNIHLPDERESATDESATFARWSRDYVRELDRHGWLDTARATWRLDQLDAAERPQEIVFAGFDAPTPTYRYLGERLAGQGTQVTWLVATEGTGGARVALPDAQSELECAARWAWAQLQARPESELLIIVADLEQRRAEVARVFSQALSPASCLIETPSHAALFGLEGGTSLSGCPLIATALTAFEFARGALTFEIASDWLRSPFLGGGLDAIARRARIDARWRRVAPPEVTLPHLIQALNGSLGTGSADPDLAQALGRFADALRQPRATLSHWSGALTRALRELGWPGTQTLDATELLMLQAFNDALAELATLDTIAGAVTLDAALRNLATLASRGRFQEPSRGRSVTISGRLADPCVRYDGIWVTGLHAAMWPGPSRPDPFIPQHLQLAAGIPEASAAGTLELARGITRSILGGAPRVVVSWPRHLADADAEPSPLLASLPAIDAAELVSPGARSYEQEIFQSGSLEVLHDEQAPAIPTPAQLRGGASALQRQSQCPFRAFAQHRLRAEPLERPLPGIDPRTRGSFLHRALDSLWSELKDRDALLGVSAEDRQGLILAVVASARSEIFGRSGRWPIPLVDLECRRLEALLRNWLEVESTRPPFRVLGVEQRLLWSEAGLTFTLRIDRIDQLDDGRTLLLDYKSGEANANRWHGERPEEPQMLLYATALERPPGAVSFALLNAEGCSFDGLTSLPPALPGLEAVADWRAQLASWRAILERLSIAFAGGDARVDPLSRLTCARCHLHALCRIDEVRAQQDAEANNE